MMIPIAKYDEQGRCIKAGYSLKPMKKAIERIKEDLTPSAETQERVEWAVAGVTMILGTVVAVEVLVAIAAIVM